MARKVRAAVDCFCCTNPDSTFYVAQVGKVSEISRDTTLYKISKLVKIEECGNCKGLGLIEKFETISFFQDLKIRIAKWIVS